MNYPISQPDTPATNSSTLTSIILNSQTQQVALVYGNGNTTIMMQPAQYSDALANFESFVQQNPGIAVVSTIGSFPALEISGDAPAAPNLNPAWVEFDLNGVDINVVSYERTTSALETVAASMVTPSSNIQTRTARHKAAVHGPGIG
ncbi:MAG: hypothetical protein ACYDGN_14670 [Acidimicrobiales bacterium]